MNISTLFFLYIQDVYKTLQSSLPVQALNTLKSKMECVWGGGEWEHKRQAVYYFLLTNSSMKIIVLLKFEEP